MKDAERLALSDAEKWQLLCRGIDVPPGVVDPYWFDYNGTYEDLRAARKKSVTCTCGHVESAHGDLSRVCMVATFEPGGLRACACMEYEARNDSDGADDIPSET